MATTTRLYTIDDIIRFEHEGRHYELLEGALIEMSPASWDHGVVAGNLFGFFWSYVREHRLGVVVAAETGFILHRDPETLLAPDVAFIQSERLPDSDDRGGPFSPIAPDLVVEVLSPSNRAGEVNAKILAYLQAGVRLVWVADPHAKTIIAYSPDEPVRIYKQNDEISGNPVLPEFRVAVAEIFQR
jgi:Uma2 family endonuclease